MWIIFVVLCLADETWALALGAVHESARSGHLVEGVARRAGVGYFKIVHRLDVV